MNGSSVTWKESTISTGSFMNLLDTYPEAKSSDFEKEYTGVVQGEPFSQWGESVVVVDCGKKDGLKTVKVSDLKFV